MLYMLGKLMRRLIYGFKETQESELEVKSYGSQKLWLLKVGNVLAASQGVGT